MDKQFYFKEGSASYLWEIIFILAAVIILVLIEALLRINLSSKTTIFSNASILIVLILIFHKLQKKIRGRKSYLSLTDTALTFYQGSKEKWKLSTQDITAVDDKQGKVMSSLLPGGPADSFPNQGFNIQTSTQGYFVVFGILDNYAEFLNNLKQVNGKIEVTDLYERRRKEDLTKDLKITKFKFLLILLWVPIIIVLVYLFSYIQKKFGG